MIDLGLRKVLESGKGILFLGAGVGYNATDPAGNHMPDGTTLAAEIAAHFSVDASGSTDLAKITQIVELRHGRPELIAFLTKRFTGFEPDASLRWLLSRTWRAIFTTNYDRLIQRAYELNANPIQAPVNMSSTSTLQAFDPIFEIPVYHVHGSLFDGGPYSILITEQDYAQFRERRKMLFEILKQEMASNTVIYFGYSHNDPNWKTILSEIQGEFSPSKMPPAYRIAPSTPPLDKEILTAQNVTTIDMTLTAFAAEANALIGELRVDPRSLDKLRESVPQDLKGSFNTNPASTMRLLNNWMYVNQEEFQLAPNIEAFLQGERPNWALVGQEKHFKRDVEEEVLDSLIDYATSTKLFHPINLILGSAGYGITTILMSLAAHLVREKAGPVFMHRPGSPFNIGDIEYACSLSTSRPYFIVDNASDYPNEINGAIFRAASTRKPACFLLGERKNEWRQLHRSTKATEFAVDPLSEAEIPRLLAFLETNRALGALEPLSPELRASAVREKHDRQLLVAMRELTEGKGFDAIIEDEYRNLATPLARDLYATVSCAYHLRQYLRDRVLASILGVDLTEMYDKTRHTTEGVVDYELVNTSSGIYGARCRHHAIAEIVWERCVQSGERERILLSMLDALNLMNFVDAELFDTLVRSERNIDVIRSLEMKTKFFEIACKKDPRSAYVRQHYARMLLRENKTELALSQIQSAITLAPDLRILYHTKGKILAEMTLELPSLEFARRRLIQSEAAYKEALRRDPKDAYAYQGLADLYINWAKKVSDEQEQADYIDRAESIVRDGLRSVRQKESLYISSAQIQTFLGHTPKAVERLKQGKASPVARYLLAQIYVANKQFKDAIEILDPLIKTDPTDPRLSMLYAKALIANGSTYADAAAVLKLSNLLGARDARYVSMLGGMNFINQKFADAQLVFEQAKKQQFPVEDEQRIFFHPFEVGNVDKNIWLKATVATVKPGYSFLSVPGYPDVFSAFFRLGKTVFQKGMQLEFQLGFSARGANAVLVRPAT